MKREEVLRFRVSYLEKKVIQRKAQMAGLSLSEYLRRLAFEKNIRARLTSEEIELYQMLTEYRINFKNISNLFKRGDVTQVKEKSVETAELLKEHLNKFK